MSDLIRPEAIAVLLRWRGVLVGAALGALGLWWGLGSGGIVAILGWALVALGAVLVWSAAQRLRFAAGAEAAPGMVEVVEGLVSYFGPSGGGFASLGEVSEILLATRGGQRAWVLRSPGQPDLVIPVGAAGADRLFDAFGSLPGLTGAALVAAVAPPQAGPSGGGSLPAPRRDRPELRRVWRRPPPAIR